MTQLPVGTAFEISALREWMQRVLQRQGMFAVDAEILIDRLWESERRGRAGLRVFRDIISGFDLGDLDPRARTLKVSDLPALAILDGSTGVGQVGATRAMQLAMDKARTAGIGLVVVRNSQPCADVQGIAEFAAAAGFLSLCATNSGKAQWPAAPAITSFADHPQAWALPGAEGAIWSSGRSLSATDFAPPSELGAWQGVISLALTSGLAAARLPAGKKKANPYGAGAEHACLAVHLESIVPAEAWQKWSTELLPHSAGWTQVADRLDGPAMLLESDTLADLAEVAQLSRVALPAAV